MALYKRSNIWWITISHQGTRIQESTGTSDKVAAQRLHDKIKADWWKKNYLGEKIEKLWIDAVMRWLTESHHKRSLRDDKVHLRWLDPHLKKYTLNQITRDVIDQLAETKRKEGVKSASVNRMLALVRAILRKAEREWGWLDKAPVVRLYQEENRRIR